MAKEHELETIGKALASDLEQDAPSNSAMLFGTRQPDATRMSEREYDALLLRLRARGDAATVSALRQAAPLRFRDAMLRLGVIPKTTGKEVMHGA